MRRIVKDGEKLYVEEVERKSEVTLVSLEKELADCITGKAQALALRAADYDTMIADFQRQIDELKALEA